MSKKLIKNMALLVALLALCLTAAFSASAATENGYTYTVTNGKATITAVDSTVTGDVVIPDTLGGYPVTEIGCSYDDNIGAFENCTGLTSVTIPESVTTIGALAFQDCTGLTSVSMGNGVRTIGEAAFDGCTGLTSITIPDSVTVIGEFAFAGCTGLTSITIPDSVKGIGFSAFAGCASVTRINWNAESVSDFESYDNVFPNGGTAGNGIEVVFGDNVKRIPAYAFNNRTGVSSITISDSVESIGVSAFAGCTGLKSITIPVGVTSITDQAFANCTGLTNINWNAKNVSLKEVADYCSVFTNAGTAADGIEVVFGDNVESIPDFAFSKSEMSSEAYDANVNIKSVTIGNSVTSIGKYAFYNCTDLTSVTIPDSVESIGSSAFAGTAWLDAQPYGDVYAGKVYYTYKGTVPENTSVVIKDGTKGIAGSAFENQHGLKSVSIPDSVTNIGDCAFYSCDFLKYTEIPGSVKTIGKEAFLYCPSLEYAYIEDGVESIGERAFAQCDSLIDIIIPDSITNLGKAAFDYCRSLESVTIGNGIQTITNQAFKDCESITEIKLSKNIKTIEEDAFTGLKNFPEVYFAGSEEEWQIVSVHNSNDMLLRGNMHYNADISHTHSYNEIAIREATCTEDGESLYICDCGKVSHIEVIPGGHNYCIDDVTEPTCTEDGYTWYYCTRCDDSYKADFVPARGYHVPGEWIYETGSCTEGGTRYKECVDCGEILESEEVEPTEHTLVTDPATPATCTTSGLTEGSHCSVCGEVLAEREYIPATGHTEVYTEYVEPTCTEDGKTVGKVCSVCGEVIIPAVTIPARGHHYTDWITTANPTCTVDGKQIKICACGLFEEQSIPATGHVDEDGDGICDNCLCVIDGTQQGGAEEQPKDFVSLLRNFFKALFDMLKRLFK